MNNHMLVLKNRVNCSLYQTVLIQFPIGNYLFEIGKKIEKKVK